MALPTTYSTGTATINANETTVTGQGTTWLTSGLQAGDLFWAGGMSVRIAAVISNTSLTLAFPWPGASRAAQVYEVRFTPDATRVPASARAVLDAIAGGNVKAFGDLISAADKLPYFSGGGTMALADLKSFGKVLIGLDSGAPGQFLRTTAGAPYGPALQAIIGGVSQSGSVPTGSLFEKGSNANGEYIRFADGTQICTRMIETVVNVSTPLGSIFYGSVSWSFPAGFPVANFGAAGSCRVGGEVVTLTGGDSSQVGWNSFLVSPVAISSATAIIRQIVIGRWF